MVVNMLDLKEAKSLAKALSNPEGKLKVEMTPLQLQRWYKHLLEVDTNRKAYNYTSEKMDIIIGLKDYSPGEIANMTGFSLTGVKTALINHSFIAGVKRAKNYKKVDNGN